MTDLPDEVTYWLFRLASSSIHDQFFCDGAYKTLQQLWKLPREHATSETPLFALSDMLYQLEYWFGLSLKQIENDEGDDIMTEDEPTKLGEDDDEVATKVFALCNWLSLWGILLRNGCVSPENAQCKTVTTCIVALVRTGLDPIVHSGNRPGNR
jgi:hypothetical protein